MSEISTCPRCQKQVCIPSGLDVAAWVRCPRCGAEYPLSEALPPELIPVVAVTTQEAAAVVGWTPTAPRRSRRRAPKSALQTIIEVVTGGLAGCLVAYYGLALYFGPQFKTLGFPNLPLVGWVTTLRDAGDAVEEKPAVEKPATPFQGVPPNPEKPATPKPASGKGLSQNVAQPPPAVLSRPRQPRAAVPHVL